MKRGKRVWQRMLTIVCLGVFIYSGTAIGLELFGYYQNRQVLAKAQTMYGQEQGMTESREPGTTRTSFDELRKVNNDIVGWINMKDTMIQYPIVQSRDNAFYLTRNYLKNDTRAGSIFMDYRNDVLHESPNTVVYGHRMRDGSMFAGLTNYLKKDFFHEHRTFQYDTLYQSYEAEIFAVYETTVDFDYIQTDFQDLGEYAHYLQAVRKKSIYQTKTDVSTDDLILTLSTCDHVLAPKNGRLVVQAKLQKVY
ncbi:MULTISPECIES: class B sortase [Bacillus]|uniref:Class B sortase n=1 Tax=Bacillus pumilus TaxID=1408 RepID=A0AAE3WL90_BACPU|nr:MULTISPECIES: class B sortase [Bacillus]MCY7618121.1 class B sortase [Bacillus pumilus]MDR4251085.1 class B sortase [Bacillus pumilus]PRS55587.1 SrtB family sortase [Bacillus sp. MZGC1]QKN77053.1 class B sortase [Bacillus pumilus]QLI43855.1 class B sortase [Bacillus pumilus]